MKTIIYISLAFTLFITACTNGNKEHEEIDYTSSNSSSPSIAVGKGPDAMFLTPDKRKLYIANVEDTTVSVINTANNQVEKTINGIRYPWGFSQLGTSNEVAISGYDKQIVIVDFTTDKIIRQRDFSTMLGGIATDKAGQFLYVIAINLKKVLKIDAITLDTLASYATGNAPDGLGISKDNNKLYVTNTEDGTISIIDMASNTSTLIKTGGKPELVHPNKDHSILYISNFKEKKIHVLDTESDKIIYEITDLDGPEEAVPNHENNKLYVVNFNSNQVFEYEIPGYKKLENIYVTGNKPIGVMPLNNKLYITNYGDNSVSVIKTN